MLTKMLSQIIPNNALTPRWATANANTNVTLTLAAITGPPLVRHTIHSVQWSYSAQPTGGRITIVDGSNTVEDLDIIAGGPGGFSVPYEGTPGNALVITLYAGGGVVGKLSAQTTSEPL